GGALRRRLPPLPRGGAAVVPTARTQARGRTHAGLAVVEGARERPTDAQGAQPVAWSHGPLPRSRVRVAPLRAAQAVFGMRAPRSGSTAAAASVTGRGPGRAAPPVPPRTAAARRPRRDGDDGCATRELGPNG